VGRRDNDDGSYAGTCEAIIGLCLDPSGDAIELHQCTRQSFRQSTFKSDVVGRKLALTSTWDADAIARRVYLSELHEIRQVVSRPVTVGLTLHGRMCCKHDA